MRLATNTLSIKRHNNYHTTRTTSEQHCVLIIFSIAVYSLNLVHSLLVGLLFMVTLNKCRLARTFAYCAALPLTGVTFMSTKSS